MLSHHSAKINVCRALSLVTSKFHPRHNNNIVQQVSFHRGCRFNSSIYCHSSNQRSSNSFSTGNRLNINTYSTTTSNCQYTNNMSQSSRFEGTTCTDLILKCTDGMELAAKRWVKTKHIEKINDDDDDSSSKTHKILCLHGWLDNSATFHLMAPYLSSQLDVEIIALDFPGHGHSSHKSSNGPTQLLSEYVLYVAEALTSLKWLDNKKINDSGTKISIIGHSMGAGVTTMFAAVYPEIVERIVLLDGLAPIAKSSSSVSRNIRNAIETRMRSNKTLYPFHANESSSTEKDDVNNRSSRKRKYPNIQVAIKTRVDTASISPGNQYISKEAAAALVCRATIRADETFDPEKGGGEEIDISYDGPIYFRHDSRLMWPSLQYFTQEQVHALLEDVKCPTSLLLAEDGWPMKAEDLTKAIDILKPVECRRLPGSHHFHADPEHSPAVSDAVIDFFMKTS